MTELPANAAEIIRAHVAESMVRVEQADRERTHGGDLLSDRETNCLSYWYPRISHEVPTPQTFWIKVSHGADLLKMVDGSEPSLLGTVEKFIDEAAQRVGFPAFLRTGQGSGKHHWRRCCFLPDRDSIVRHIGELVEWSNIVDFMGLPHNVWVVRKMLDVEPMFRCNRYGGMPVVREWRYFVEGGRLLYGNPYWPEEALEEGRPDAANWRDSLSRLNAEPPAEVAEMACKAGAAVGGRWSVDCLEARDGWYVTDMAIAENSYGWDESKLPSR